MHSLQSTTYICIQSHSLWWGESVPIPNVSCQMRLPAVDCMCVNGSNKLLLNERELKGSDDRFRMPWGSLYEDHHSQWHLTIHLWPFTSVTQDMTQSWPSQQALEGDQAQRILYNPKVCVLVCFYLISKWGCHRFYTLKSACSTFQSKLINWHFSSWVTDFLGKYWSV